MIKLIKDDITTLEVEAIVNAANPTLLGGGGVDGAIHRAAGPALLRECISLKGCKTGDAKLTNGYALPAKYVIHAVGPVYQAYTKEKAEELLEMTYRRCMQIAIDKNIRTIAFPCISTGIYGFPKQEAAKIATALFHEYEDYFDEIIVCTFEEVDFQLYKNLLN